MTTRALQKQYEQNGGQKFVFREILLLKERLCNLKQRHGLRSKLIYGQSKLRIVVVSAPDKGLDENGGYDFPVMEKLKTVTQFCGEWIKLCF